jgi:RNA polymerase sigma-70 factor (ECF subfamily)
VLAEAFRSRWTGAVAPEPEDDDALEAALGAMVERGRAAWPRIALAETAFVEHVASRLAGEAMWSSELAELKVEDLYLAFACFRGDAHAVAAFDATFLAEVPRYVARLRPSADFVDELRQALRLRLLVGVGGGAAKIGEYAGRGPLGGWVRVTAIRTALNMQRSGIQHEPAAAPPVVPAGTPELDLLRARYATEVGRALETTIRGLTVDQRNVLRMHYLDGLSIDAIAAVYGVHRSTSARWITETRDAIVDETKRRLKEVLALTGSEVSSILALVQSQLEISLRGALPRD